MSKAKDEQIKQLQEEVEHYKLYYKAWQRARGMVVDLAKERNKTERDAMADIYHAMTQSIDHEVKKIKL